MTFTILLFVLTFIAAVFAVLAPRVLYAAFGLAVTSVLVTILLYHFHSPIAGIIELSVCAGLITVIFISVISLVKPTEPAQRSEVALVHYRKYVYLPFVLLLIGGLLVLAGHPNLSISLPPVVTGSVQEIFWNTRQVDLIGQVVVLLAGVFGIVILFREGVTK